MPGPRRLALLALAASLSAAAASAARPPARAVASVRVVEGPVEHGRGESWSREERVFRMAPGERVRTGRDGLAVLSLPWMEILVGADSVVALPLSQVLSTSLEQGRIEQRAASDILKVTTAEAEVRGRGSVVVRRTGGPSGTTAVTPLDGTFVVRTKRHALGLAPGQGALIRAGNPQPEPAALPPSPLELQPGTDPVYVERGHSLTLAWTGAARRYHVEVATVSGEEVLLAREVAGTTLPLGIAWPGTFRWRVSAIDESGLEGPPSAPGFFCVVEK